MRSVKMIALANPMLGIEEKILVNEVLSSGNIGYCLWHPLSHSYP
jgi:hypothetical protein